ncbi:hypothetical protein HAX54_026822 [Datura stramonium]|uniref:Uncharacterized protein n=1 Tax=Datura stramonium TaxID=4076 RepID=A0ABS8V4N8_DATST|nr:hypothetical protein [Datura stramonium]
MGIFSAYPVARTTKESDERCTSNDDNYQVVHQANLQEEDHFVRRLIYKLSLEAFALILSLKATIWDFRWKCTSKDNHHFVRQTTLQVAVGVIQPRGSNGKISELQYSLDCTGLTSSRSSSWRKYTPD